MSTTLDFPRQLFLAVTASAALWYLLSGAGWASRNVRISLVGNASHTTEAHSKPTQTALAQSGPAPTDPDAFKPGSAEEYIQRYAPVAIDEMRKFNIPASISLAQGLVESNAGNSGLAQQANNHFGIKCFSKKHRGCCIKWKDDTNADGFRLFKSAWFSWREHSRLLARRYSALSGKDHIGWASGLQSMGYATDPYYAKTLLRTIKKYNLTKFDQ